MAGAPGPSTGLTSQSLPKLQEEFLTASTPLPLNAVYALWLVEVIILIGMQGASAFQNEML
jgi:hypothetical protein